MSKLTDFYAHKASLQEEGKPIDPQWEQLENQLLQEEYHHLFCTYAVQK